MGWPDEEEACKATRLFDRLEARRRRAFDRGRGTFANFAPGADFRAPPASFRPATRDPDPFCRGRYFSI